jgi:cell division protein ZapE
MSLIEQYHSALKQPDMVHDTAQEQVILKLSALSKKLMAQQQNTLFYRLRKHSPIKRFKPKAVPGLYLWGGVGRGKTWLMNLFYEELPIEEKKRMHFHHFMLDIHRQLGASNKQKNPLQQIARELANRYKVMCIDEFIVTNITDAMILSELLHALFKNQVCLVATSNRIPDDLYLNGLQRERFIPAIELIKTFTEVFHLDAGVDHRTSLLELAEIYYHPITEDTERQIEQRMRELAITPVVEAKVITILDREIKTVRCSDDIAWFDFEIICTAPRAAQDYILIAQQYSTVIISNIPVLDEHSDDKARRFIYLIDALYDRNVKLIASAYSEAEKIYQGNMLEFAFHRTSSRLIEMRSHQYLSKPHKAFK